MESKTSFSYKIALTEKYVVVSTYTELENIFILRLTIMFINPILRHVRWEHVLRMQ